MKSFSWLTTTANASVPTRNSIGSRPIAWQLSISVSLIARDAFDMSVSPATQNRSKPAPLPMLSMVMFPAYPSSWNRSAIRSLNGNTVELPAVMMSPVTLNGSTAGSSPAIAISPSAGASSSAIASSSAGASSSVITSSAGAASSAGASVAAASSAGASSAGGASVGGVPPQAVTTLMISSKLINK